MEAGAPGGGLIRIIPKTAYALQPTANTTETILVAKYVDTTFWVSGALIVRRHSSSLVSGQSVTVRVQNTSFAEEDPATDFAESGTERALVTITSSTTQNLLVASLAAPIAAQVRVTVSATQPVGGSSAMSFTIGVDLVGRPA